MKRLLIPMFVLAVSAVSSNAHSAPSCAGLPNYEALKKALMEARKQDNGGLNNDMWGAIVDRSGTVCAIAFTGKNSGAQWPGSRLIAAEKANTANGLSVDSMALSTANLYAGGQPGGFLFGLDTTNPVLQTSAAKGPAEAFGSEKDPLVGEKIGGIVTFGGGLALYDKNHNVLGAVGVSGDTSCADHNIAWRLRNALALDHVPNGVAKGKGHNDDQIIFDIGITGKSKSGFGHPTCVGKEKEIAAKLPDAK